MLGKPQNRPGHGGEEKNSQLLPGLIQPIVQRYTTELSRLSAYVRAYLNQNML